jgi:hypothetical protein
MEGKRCGYFEAAVLPTAAYTGQLVRITQLYERRVGAPGITGQASVKTRSCPDSGFVGAEVSSGSNNARNSGSNSSGLIFSDVRP